MNTNDIKKKIFWVHWKTSAFWYRLEGGLDQREEILNHLQMDY